MAGFWWALWITRSVFSRRSHGLLGEIFWGLFGGVKIFPFFFFLWAQRAPAPAPLGGTEKNPAPLGGKTCRAYARHAGSPRPRPPPNAKANNQPEKKIVHPPPAQRGVRFSTSMMSATPNTPTRHTHTTHTTLSRTPSRTSSQTRQTPPPFHGDGSQRQRHQTTPPAAVPW